MKRILFFVSALAGLFFAASCQQENLDPMSGGSNVVTYTVEVPGALSTKAIGTNVSAVTELIYEVYLVDSNTKVEKKLYRNTETISNGTATVELELVNNQDFRVLFWAQVPDNGVYTTNSDLGLKAVTLKTDLSANAENYAAFADSDFIEYGEPLLGRTITLSRPVAQLNIATTPESLKLGEKADGTEAQTTITFKNTGVTVEGLSTTYNVATGEAGSDSDVFTYEANLPYDSDANTPDNLSEKTLKVGTEDYTYVSMNYVGFAQPTGDNVKVTYTIETNEVGTIKNTISNVPVKANYRTNIIGNLITSMSDYKVTLESDWTDLPGGNMEVIAEGLVKNINGDYEVTNAAGLAYAINKKFANGGNFYLTKELYEMAGYDVNPPKSVTGSLNVYGEIPVVTRSTAGVVTITGLDLTALVPVVSAGGSASFSNIILDSATDFVGTNNGTVGFDNCSNNEGSSTEQIVGTNNGTVVDLSAEIETLSALQDVINTGTKDIKVTQTLVNKTEFTLDLKGSTINGVDNNTSGNFYLIDNRAKLTIKNSASTPATITLKANNNRNWNASSVVVANNPGGNLIIKGDEGDVVIEHLGGSDMAYGVDNLTNGKGTSAIATLDGATVKSTYRAIRQFLNGIEAINELYVNAGSKIYGPNNKSIWMQDPSKNANTGKLVVDEGAELYGDVYLSVTEGSTEWPVSVSIASSALVGGSEVLTANLPEGYSVDEQEGAYVVNYKSPSQSRFEELIKNGGDVTLNENVELNSTIEIPSEMVLSIDLNNHTLTTTDAIINSGKLAIIGSGTVENKYGYIVENMGDLTINGPTLKGLGVIRSNDGKVTIDGGTFTASSDWNVGTYQHILKAVNTEATINGGVFDATIGGITNAMINVSENSTVTINGGDFRNVADSEVIPQFAPYMFTYEKNGKLIINDGSFYGGWRFNGETSTTDIHGGDFTVSYDGQSFHATATHVLTIYGGTFSLANGGKLNPSNHLAEGYKVVEADGKMNVVLDPAAQIGETKYATLKKAAEAATTGDTIDVLRDLTLSEALTLPAGITLNGNGNQINGTIYAGGDLTFAGHTKVTSFSASYYNRTITIGVGACLEVTGTGRVTLGYGNTFDITGNIENAKTADKASEKPSLIIPGGISITGGNGATMNVKDAYVQIGSTTSKPGVAHGNFSLNFKNSIVDFTKEFGFYDPTGGVEPSFKMSIENSLFTTGTKLYLTNNSEVNVDGSNVILGTYIRNSGQLNLTSGSVLTGSTIQFGENGGNDGIITVDASTLKIVAGSTGHAFDGKGEGMINATNGASVSVDYYKAMTITTDATSKFEGTKVE